MLSKAVIEFGYVSFWFICWQLLAFLSDKLYKRFLKAGKKGAHDEDT